MRIRIHLFISMRIRIRPFTLNPDQTFADSYPDPVPRQTDASLPLNFKDPPRPHFEPSCTSIVSVYGPPLLQPALDFDADPDIDPDPAYQNDTESCGRGSTTLLSRHLDFCIVFCNIYLQYFPICSLWVS
jgi:hypothetical protein